MNPENILYFSLAFLAFCNTLALIYVGYHITQDYWDDNKRVMAVIFAITFISLSFFLFSIGLLSISQII